MTNIDHNTCLGCGYILDGLDQPRCPECGREFDPNDLSTFLNVELRLMSVRAHLRRARTAVWCLLACLFICIFILIAPQGWASHVDPAAGILLITGMTILGVITVSIFAASLQVNGIADALTTTYLLVLLTLFFGVGLFVIPAMVEAEAIQRFRANSASSE